MSYILLQTGTWTPQIQFGGAAVGITYSKQVGLYTIVGGLVYYQFEITLSSQGSSTGQASLVGIPFNFASLSTETLIQSTITLPIASQQSGLSGNGSPNQIQSVRVNTTTSNQVLSNTNFSNTSSYFGTIVGLL